MSNLTTYNISVVQIKENGSWVLVRDSFVKFNDIKEFLKPTANTGSPKLPTLEETKSEVCRYFNWANVEGSDLSLTKCVYDFICRQVQAGA